MMESIPWEIRGSEFLQDIFVEVENARRQGIRGGDKGNCQCMILHKWQGHRRDITYRVRRLT
jgi:hypothetical protein